MILLIDNYDSFSYNLYQLIGTVNPDIRVIRNDEISVDAVEQLQPELIVLSPGPGKPSEAGICEEVVHRLAGKIPIFGVCLGHQAICEAFGAKIGYAKELMHGKTSDALLEPGSRLFKGMGEHMQAARYHSLAADPDSMPEELLVTARTADGEIMAVEHREYPVYGVQFHPESVLTPEGMDIIRNLVAEAAESKGMTERMELK